MVSLPLVSIIIPNYNNEKYLAECLDSCIHQTYENIEIIIIDDCSNDNSINIIKEYQSKDNRIKLIQNETNQKVSRTRHIGIENSSSKWISTLDSDDFYISKEKIEKEFNLLKKYCFQKNIIAYSGIVHVNNDGKKLRSIMKKSNTLEGDIFDSLIIRECAIPRDFLFSKELYFESGGFDFDIPIYEDWDLKLRLSKKAKYYYSNIDGVGYRVHNTGLSSAKRKEHLKWLSYCFEKNTENIDLLEREKLYKLFQQNIYSTFLERILRKLKRALIL